MNAFKKQLALVFKTLLFSAAIVLTPTYAHASDPPKGKALRAIYNNLPGGYTQLGSTTLYYRQTTSAIDLIGMFDGKYYSSTYSNGGYRTAMGVEGYSAQMIDCLNGTTIDGVTVRVSIIEEYGLARFIYTVSNTNPVEKTISLGSRADVMIGNNDRAPIATKRYLDDTPYGLSMSDSNSAEAASLVLLFGEGIDGVVPVDNYWFGYYGIHSSAYEIIGNYSTTGNNLYEENGSYDSGLGWCWKNRTIAGNSVAIYSVLIGVGDVTLLPMIQNMEITRTSDIAEWNDLTTPYEFTVSGVYFSPEAEDGLIYYSVDEGEWQALTDTIASEEAFDETIAVFFRREALSHSIKLCAKDRSGDYSPTRSTVFRAVASLIPLGLFDQEYTGEPIELPALSFSDPQTGYTLTEGLEYNQSYENNINAGQASIRLSGIYPHTIDEANVHFTIRPTNLRGEIEFDVKDYIYNGLPITPAVEFEDERFGRLRQEQDFTVDYIDNLYPGTATIVVSGTGNFAGDISSSFEIHRKDIELSSLHFAVPGSETCYDGQPHGIIILMEEGMGECLIYYRDEDGMVSTEAPVDPGTYTASFSFEEGRCYNAASFSDVASYTIYALDEQEWNVLTAIYTAMNGPEWNIPWDIAGGIRSAGNFHGVMIAEGHVVGLNLSENKLSGRFPFEILSLPMLHQVDLSNNKLTGNIDDIELYLAGEAAGFISSINISANALSGNIGVFASKLPFLYTLNASHNKLSDASPALSQNIQSLDLCCQRIDRTVDLDLRQSPGELIAAFPTICTYPDASALLFSLTDASVDTDWQVSVDYSPQTGLQFSQLSEDNAYRGANGALVYCTVSSGVASGSTFTGTLSFAEGDADFSGSVSVNDLQAVINFAFGDYTLKPFNMTASDLVQDDRINVQDVVRVVQLLLSQYDAVSTQDVAPGQRRVDEAETQAGDASVYWEDGNLILFCQTPVAALDLVVANAGGKEILWKAGEYGFSCALKEDENRSHAVLYSLSGATFPAGKNVIATTEADSRLRVLQAYLSDADANTISASLNANNDYTGIASAENELIEIEMKENACLALRAKQTLTKLSCRIYGMDGSLIAEYTAPSLPAGTGIEIPCGSGVNTYVIIRLDANECSPVVKKVILK